MREWVRIGQLKESLRALVCVGFLVLSGCSFDAMISSVEEIKTVSISGKIANYSSASAQASIQEVSSLNCASPVVSVYKINVSGQRVTPAIASTPVSADGTYLFSAEALGDYGDKTEFASTAMMIEVQGCESSIFFRPVTGVTEQNVTMASSLFGYLLNTDQKARLSTVLQSDPKEFARLITMLGSPSTVEKAYEILVTNSEASDIFTSIFGVGPETLMDASPEVLLTSLPTGAQEKIAVNMKANAIHWASLYTIAYQWKLDSAVIGTQKDFDYSAGGNSQGSHTLTLTIGKDDGSGQIDLTKPYKTYSSNLEITNNVLPQAPTFLVTTPADAGSTPVNTRSLVLTLNTGTDLANCDTFSSLLVNEDASLPQASLSFPITCTQSGSQNVNYTLSSASDGVKTIYLWAKDASGVISTSPSTVQVTLDTTAPTVSITTQPLAQSKSSSQSFAFTGDDGIGTIDHFECKMDSGSWVSCSSPTSYASLAEGDHTLSLRAIDTAGNISAVDSKTWHIDLTVPVLNLTGPASITNSLSAVFTLAATDSGGSGVSSYSCSIDGAAYVACTSVVNYVLAAGSHVFKARAYDGAGNASAIQTYSWVIDTTPPTVTITSKPASLTNAMTAAFSFVGSDTGGANIAGYECQLDGSAFAACTTGKSYSSLADGSHTFQVRALDTAGNTGSAVSYTWTVNTTTPMASISSSPDSITNQTSATFVFSATAPSGGSITGYECNINGAGWVSCVSPKTYTGLVQGSQSFAVRSIDNNSNPSDPTSYAWVIDTTVPTLSISSKPGAITNSATAQFVFAGADTGGASIDTYYCQLDGAGYAECSSPRNLSSLAQGTYTFDVKVTDTAGNTSAVQSATWIVDLTPPSLTMLTTPDSLTNATTAAFTFSASDLGGGAVAGYECSLDGGTVVACNSGVSYSSLAAGAHSFEVFAYDSAGNSSSTISYSWTVDLTAPTVTLTSKPSLNSNSASASFSFTGSDTGGGSVAGYKCKIDSGSYAACTTGVSYSSLADGSHTFAIYATDTAGNQGTAITYTWTVDTVAPTVAITNPSVNATVIPTSSLSAVTVSGTCTENGTSVTVSGVSTVIATCASGVWTTSLNLASVSDATYTLTASQTDAAGNVGTATRTVIKDSTAPVIVLTTPSAAKGGSTMSVSWVNTESNVATSSSFTVEFYDGTSWSSLGTKTATAGANSAVSYSLTGVTVPSLNTSSAKVRVSLTDAAGNATTVTSNSFIVDTSAPTLSAFTVNGGSPSTTNNNVLIGFTGSDSLTNISKICMQTTSTVPTSASTCWVNVTSYGLTAAKSLSTNSIYFNIGLVSGTFPVYIWLMDAVGNISTNSATVGLDKGSVVYNSPSPPAIGAIQLVSTDTPGTPPAGTDLKVTSGNAIYLKWNITSSTGLGSSPITVTYTTNDSTDTGTLSTSLVNAANGSCTVPSGYTGCAVFLAPVSTYFRLKLKVTDTMGFTTAIVSNPLNSGSINFLAGNTDLGLGSSAKSAIIRPTTTNSLAVLDDGRIFVADSRGLGWVNPTNGVYEIIAATTGTASGDGGVLTSAKFKSFGGIWVDNNNDILIADDKIIRKINTRVSPMTIARFIGGGSDTSSYVATATNYSAASAVKRLSVSSNGDIYFIGESSKKIRKYTASTGAVSQITLSGVGNTYSTTMDNTNCTSADYFITFDSDGSPDKMVWELQSTGTGTSCATFSTTEGRVYAQVDPTTGVSLLPAPSFINTTSGSREYINFYNDKAGNVYTGATSSSSNAKGIFKFNTSTLKWTRVYGSGSHGTCADGTSQDQCAITALAVTFNSQGQLFYVDAKGNAVRTVDYEGKVRTLAGDRLGSENGKQVLATRFNNLTDVKSYTASGVSYISAYDFDDVRIREFIPGETIYTVAGVQYSAAVADGAVAATNPIPVTQDSAPIRFLEAANGDIYLPRAGGSLSRIVRATGLWEELGSGYSYGPGGVALSPTNILLSSMSYNGTLIATVDSRMYSVDLTTKVSTKIVYLTGASSIGSIPSTVCADGSTVAGGCFTTGLAKDTGYQGVYDSVTNTWLIPDSSGTRIGQFAFDGSGTMQTFFSGTRGVSRFDVNRNADLTKNYLYLCSSGVLYKYDLNNSNAESVIALPNSTITCDGAVHYDSNRNSLLFVYKQNGLEGLAEVVDP